MSLTTSGTRVPKSASNRLLNLLNTRRALYALHVSPRYCPLARHVPMASHAVRPPWSAENAGPSSSRHTLPARPFSSTRPASKKYKGNPDLPMYNWKRACEKNKAELIYITKRTHADSPLAKLAEIMEGLLIEERVLGFDMEWRPVFQAGKKAKVALIQLAYKNTVWLIHISKMGGPPELLKNILEDPTIVKTGVGIQFDCKKLWQDWKVNVRNVVDLSLLARSADNKRWKGPYAEGISLLRLTEKYVKCTLDKGKVTTSNWELTLDHKMQQYAANDSHVSYVIYKELAEMLRSMDPAPPLGSYSFSTVEGVYVTLDSDADKWKPLNPLYNAGPPPPPTPDPDAPSPIKVDELGEIVPFGIRGGIPLAEEVDLEGLEGRKMKEHKEPEEGVEAAPSLYPPFQKEKMIWDIRIWNRPPTEKEKELLEEYKLLLEFFRRDGTSNETAMALAQDTMRMGLAKKRAEEMQRRVDETMKANCDNCEGMYRKYSDAEEPEEPKEVEEVSEFDENDIPPEGVDEDEWIRKKLQAIRDDPRYNKGDGDVMTLDENGFLVDENGELQLDDDGKPLKFDEDDFVDDIRLNEDGFLVDENGELQLDDDGKPIKFDEDEVDDDEDLRLNEDGFLVDENGELELDDDGKPIKFDEVDYLKHSQNN
ncbi:hypothetical protein OBBRIDRAFT_833249 [Obba rivulosa]|uniref:3'-5' exonuclease n=1 Tax=Obba rivulosa TaxID=1052685 RepID=A0A8E2B5W5_9APHY|nr:hypothetical protein OBBRIDRAFT_833249 [Obba rivulosa]